MSIKLKGSSDGSVSFDAPSDTSPSGSDITLTLPTSAGSANQFLKNSGIAGELEYSSMVETSTGVGIGETNPATKLHLKLDTDKHIRFQGNIGEIGSVPGSQGVTDAGGLTGLGIRGNDLRFATGSAERMRLDSSGRLLVGTSTAPSVGSFASSAKLVSQGNTIESIGGAILSLQRGEAATSITSGEYLGSICFTDNAGSEFARIDAKANGTAGSNDYPGSLSFSTTTDNLGSPSEKMLLKQNGQISSYCLGQYARVIESSRSANTSNYLIFGRHSASNITGSGGTQSFAVYTNGNVQNTNNSYSQLSDVKLKENIVDANSQWDDLKAIQIRNWNFKEETGYETHTQIGVVAQEIETVSPGLVYDTPDRDDEGNDLGTVTKAVNYSVLYVKAVKALQEAQTRIETLESQHADLLARVTALEAA